jgi:serine phosphatase RsbU (regulator of sigma subunit)
MPVGVYGEDLKDFSTFKINLHKNDIIYTTTDGFPDQFGGPKGRKFMYKRFENMLIEMANLSMHEQKNNLKKSLTEWTHHTDANNNNIEYAQVDDITVLGIKI